MRHASRTQSFSRPYNQRVWLMRNLVISLVEHERISTTLAKAKELRRWAEKAITLGKRGTIADRRLLLARIPNQNAVAKVFSELAPRFKDRNGGYTRIYRMMRRPGDNAEMALIEFLDAQLKKPGKETTKKADKAKKDLAAGGKEAKAAKVEARKAEGKAKKEARAAKAEQARDTVAKSGKSKAKGTIKKKK
jgi:large subunit ribosomal protein L17